jgi:hypothetical protein
MFDNLFGGDDDEDDWEVEVHTGFRRPSRDDDGGGLFRTHTIDLGTDGGTATDDGGATAPATAPESPSTPASPGTGTGTGSGGTAGTHDRGTFVFPTHQHFMQMVATRGLNGAHPNVETVYVLAGPTYTTPTDLFRLDDPDYYTTATRTKVSSYGRKMAEKVANCYPDGQAPKLLARFHTHPSGSTRPSDTDKGSAAKIASHFENAFGTSDFEFFHGIHAYSDHGGNPKPGERHDPSARSNVVSWRGEAYDHDLALYGRKFRNPKQVVIADD